MMKAYIVKTALLVLMAGATLSVSAMPAQVQQWEKVVVADRQSENLIVVARGGFAGTTLGPKRDISISVAKP